MDIEVTKANDIGPTQGSFIITAGPPGLGKSWLAGTMAEYLDPKEVLVIATLPREVNSLQYQAHNLDTIVITDDGWNPSEGELNPTGYDELMKIVRTLRTDTKYAGVIIDNGTEAAELAWHAALEPYGVGDPGDLTGGNRFGPYTSLREKMEELICGLSTLTGKTGFAERPKLICMPWHIQPPKETSDDADSADQKGKGSEYEGEYLPMIRGAYRRRIGGIVDATVYANLVSVPGNNSLSAMENHYCIQVISDKERHVKLPGRQPDPKKLLKGKYVDIHNRDDAWRVLMSIVDGTYEEGK